LDKNFDFTPLVSNGTSPQQHPQTDVL